ncbi:MAG: methyltransferase type 11 [Parcubacteria group bacterium CG11_big_fil_rev_8_21_14_0_20_41_14]|nr:MAG: methyltransferase type 11 [Parcubacteria group bacterium CG22_combo_CG10-13_8_21_14_all_41_9]PIQ80293.1 MAG: methyltransferase type 11 [Parcubacteria group bacterium CG11_big_fil_rev_8_21_14_0_20_41_14]PIR57233.1 MAG: methyltransferase type 11 [Parcubacteria group bacterium CG10_big_fil_rev_8_21_14_0_10_41_35]
MQDNKKNKYYNFKYEPLPRWCSYWYQIHEVLSLQPENVLEIGVGNRIVSEYLKHSNTAVTTLDIDASLQPDVVASVIAMPVPDKSYSVVLAAEILEHLSFEDLKKALKEIYRASKDYAVISLPDCRRIIAVSIKLPLFNWMRFVIKIPFSRQSKTEDAGHFWEIGKKGYSVSRIKKEMRNAEFEILKDYNIVEYPYHHFFILKKK